MKYYGVVCISTKAPTQTRLPRTLYSIYEPHCGCNLCQHICIVLEYLIFTSWPWVVPLPVTTYTLGESKKDKDFGFQGPILFTSFVILLVANILGEKRFRQVLWST